MKTTKKKVKLTLVGLDGNAYALMGAFARQAKKEKWTDAEVEGVLKKAKSGDYDNLLRVLMAHCDEDEDYMSDEDDN